MTNKDFREWQMILQAVAGITGFGILWWQTSGWLALSVFLLICSRNIKEKLKEN